MNINLLIFETISGGITFVTEWLQDFNDIIVTLFIYIAELTLFPLELGITVMHYVMLRFLQYAPYPGMNDESNTAYIFANPPDDGIFSAMHAFITGYIEPLALFFVFFAIVVLLFLRVFDVVLDDIGLDTEEAKKRLFLAPLLIILWLPLANLVLYFAFGMTEFISSIEFFSIDNLDTSNNERVLTESGGIDIGSYFGALLPETGDVAPQLSFISIGFAYLAAVPAAIIYLIAMILSVLRVVGLVFFYALGPIGVVLWAFNWRDLGKIGGKIMRYFVLFSLFPIVVAFINLMLPLSFVLVAEVLDGIMGELANNISGVATGTDEGITTAELNMVSSDKILAIIFILITPLIVGLVPWGIIIGFERAMKLGVAGGLAATGGAVLGAGVMAGVAAKGTMAMGAAAKQAHGMKNKTGVRGTLSAASSGLRNGNARGTLSQLGSNTADRIRDNIGTAQYGLKKMYGETSFTDIEEYAAESGIMRDNFAEFGDVLHKGIGGHLTAKEKMGAFQALKEDRELQEARGYPDSLASPVPLKNGVLDEEKATDKDRLIWESRQAELRATGKEMGNSFKSGRAKQRLGDYLADEKGLKHLGGKTVDEAEELIPDELLAEEYYEIMGDENKNLGHVWSPSQIDDLNSSARNVTRENVENNLEDDKNKYYRNNFDEFRKYHDETYGSSEVTNIQADFQDEIYHNTGNYQEGFDEAFMDELKNQLGQFDIMGDLNSSDVDTLTTEWIQSGGTQNALQNIISGELGDKLELEISNTDKIQKELNEAVSNSGVELSGEYTLDTDNVESVLSEYDAARKGQNSKPNNINHDGRVLSSHNFEKSLAELSNAVFNKNEREINARIEGTVIEESITNAINDTMNNISQKVDFNVDSPTVDLDTKIKAGDFLDKKSLQQQIGRKIIHNARLNDIEVSSDDMSQMIDRAVSDAEKIANNSIKGLQEDYIEQFENSIEELDSIEYENIEKDMSPEFKDFFDSVKNTQNSLFEELNDIEDTNDRVSRIKEIKEINQKID